MVVLYYSLILLVDNRLPHHPHVNLQRPAPIPPVNPPAPIPPVNQPPPAPEDNQHARPQRNRRRPIRFGIDD